MKTFKELETRHHVEVINFHEKVVQRKIVSQITLKVTKEQLQALASKLIITQVIGECVSIVMQRVNRATLLDILDDVLFQCDLMTFNLSA